MTTETQNKAILAHLQKGGTITFWDAVEDFGVMHLPRRILDLKQAGHNIVDRWETNEAGKRFKRWWLAK